MFSLDSDLRLNSSNSNITIGPEGESDDNPIRLQGDTADEFRALLWALYSLYVPSDSLCRTTASSPGIVSRPNELSVALTPKANPLQLFNLARISHKYEFRSIEAWALNALTLAYTRPMHPPNTKDGEGPSLEQLTELASLCEQRDLLEAATQRWKRRLASGKDISLAINVAERLNLRALLGRAYYVMLLQGREVWDTDGHLTRSQIIRLLSGHYSLGRLWDRLPHEPPALVHSPRCMGATLVRCNQAWSGLWKSMMDIGKQGLLLHYPDVEGKLILAEGMLKTLIDRDTPTPGMLEAMPWCRDQALIAMAGKVKEIQESLADYFVDVI